jgi:anti-sigma factor RsiW
MNCKAVEKASIAYLDGSIEPRQRREVEEHLTACGACREHSRQLRAIWGILDEAPAFGPSPSFDAAVRARISQEAHRPGLWGWLIPSPRLALGVTALLVFSLWLSSLPPAERPPVAVATQGDTEFRMIADLPVLEDYDVLSSFDALSELPMQPAAATRPGM